jgi:hypothetical protein
MMRVTRWMFSSVNRSRTDAIASLARRAMSSRTRNKNVDLTAAPLNARRRAAETTAQQISGRAAG